MSNKCHKRCYQYYSKNLGYQINKSTQVDANINYADIDLYDPGKSSAPFQNNWYDVLRYGGDLNFTHSGNLGESNLKFHGNFGEHHFYDGWQSHDRTLGCMFYQNMSFIQGQTMTFGFDYKEYGGDAIEASTDRGEFFIS